MLTTKDFQVGEQVRFGRGNGEQTLGEIVKVNPKKLKVKQLEGRGTMKSHAVGTIWTVPPSLCTKMNGAKAPVGTPLIHIPPFTSRPTFAAGDRVEFTHGGRVITGTVQRVNRKTTTVIPDNATTPSEYWRVSHRNLRATTTTAPKNAPSANVGDKDAEERAEWKRFATSYGFDPEWIGMMFTSKGTDYIVTGLSSHRAKYPVSHPF